MAAPLKDTLLGTWSDANIITPAGRWRSTRRDVRRDEMPGGGGIGSFLRPHSPEDRPPEELPAEDRSDRRDRPDDDADGGTARCLCPSRPWGDLDDRRRRRSCGSAQEIHGAGAAGRKDAADRLRRLWNVEYRSTIGGPGGGSRGAPEGGERSGAVVPRDFLARRMASSSSSTADGGGVMVGVVSRAVAVASSLSRYE